MTSTHPIPRFPLPASAACLLLVLALVQCDTTSQPAPPNTLTNTVGIVFQRIEAGTFRMGADGPDGPQPAHTVHLSEDFYLGVYEVTQAQWEAVMGETPSAFAACGGDCPVEQVAWDDVQRFIQALNAQEGTTAYRLPTEAEWEYAARAGTATAYSFGDDDAQLPQYGWYRDNADTTTHPVGQKPANPWGLYDMHGNVYEWVADWFDRAYYQVSPAVDPAGPAQPPASEQPFPRRVVRGGSWLHDAPFARSARRNQRTPASQLVYVGFRLAKTID